MENVLIPKEVNVEKITFSDVKTSDVTGAKNAWISYGGDQLYVQTPTMNCVYGLSKWKGEAGKPDKYSIELSFQGMETNKSLAKFMDVVKALNEKVINTGFQKAPEWFRKKFQAVEYVESIYKSPIKYSKDKETGEITDKYAPTLRINIPVENGKVTCPVYDDSKDPQLVDLMSVESKGAKMAAILKVSGVWIAGGQFGVTLRVQQLRVHARKTITGCAFKDDEDDANNVEDSDIEDDDCVDNDDHSVDNANAIHDGDEDGEEEDVAEPTQPEPQAPAPKAKVAPKKAPVHEVEDSDDEDALEKPKVVKNVVRKKK